MVSMYILWILFLCLTFRSFHLKLCFLYNSDSSLCMHYDYNEYTIPILFGSNSEAKKEKGKLILELDSSVFSLIQPYSFKLVENWID